ncbi:MAG: cation diffusion facilitator family transporter [Actinomycetota bacterium]|nr:cation diffusion facilitator family transporter [Actinomycetota bacterium]
MESARKGSRIEKFNTFLLKRFVRDYENVHDTDVRASYGYIEGVLGASIEVLLFTSKLIIGLLSGSIALIAEAFHSLSDIFSSLIVIFGFRFAKQPPDPEHPYGYGRFEAIATLVAAVILVVLGLEIASRSIERLLSPTPIALSYIAIGVLVVNIALKEFLARIAIDLGRRIEAQVLVADSLNQRVDSLAAVVVMLGLIGASFGFNQLDAIAGLAVVGFIFYTAYDIARDASNILLGQAPSEDTIELVRLIARSVDGVKGAHAIHVHDYGVRKVVTVHILVDKDLTVEASHDISHEVASRIGESMPGATAEVHVGPAYKLKTGPAPRVQRPDV